jgi:hypothetical protein
MDCLDLDQGSPSRGDADLRCGGVGCNPRARDDEAWRYEPALPQCGFGSPPAPAPNPGRCFRRDTIRRRRLGWRREYSPRVGNGWHYLTSPVGSGLSVWLADRVVPWHNFNLVGFGAVNLQACHSKHQASRCQAETLSRDRCCIGLWARPSRLPGNAATVPFQRCEMKNSTFVAELHQKLGAPSSETLESLRLLKAFIRLAPRHRSEVIELVERLAADELSSTDHPLS